MIHIEPRNIAPTMLPLVEKTARSNAYDIVGYHLLPVVERGQYRAVVLLLDKNARWKGHDDAPYTVFTAVLQDEPTLNEPGIRAFFGEPLYGMNLQDAWGVFTHRVLPEVVA